jgi:hypothetical protein
MEEGRKRVLLIVASILAARKLAMYEGGTRVPATVSANADAVRWAEMIMAEIDKSVTCPSAYHRHCIACTRSCALVFGLVFALSK